MDQALLVDPLDVGINMNVGDHMILQRRYDTAVQAFGKALELAPGHRPEPVAAVLGACARGSARPLNHCCRNSSLTRMRIHSGTSTRRSSQARRVTLTSALSHYEAMESLAAGQRVSSWTMARAAAAATQDEKVLAWLDAAATQLSSSLSFMLVTPAFDRLQGDPRFLALGAATRAAGRRLTRRPAAQSYYPDAPASSAGARPASLCG